MPISVGDIHRSQFAVTTTADFPFDEWLTLDAGGGWFLHHHPALNVEALPGHSVLIGSATELRHDRPTPQEALSSNSFELSGTDSWAGRWCILRAGIIFSDVSALLSLFYGQTPAGPCVSSSLAVIAALKGSAAIPSHAPMKGKGLDWMPPPMTIIPGIICLLPGQTLVLEDDNIRLDQRAASLRPADLPAADAVAAFADALAQGLRTFDGGYLLPLTAGLDSRTVLAALKRAGKPFVAFTHRHMAMSHGDRTIPPRLARQQKFSHLLIRDAAHVEQAEVAIERHSYGQLHQNKHFFAHDHYAALEDYRQWTMLPGGCFEVGRCYYWPYLPETLPENTDEAVDAILDGLNAQEAAPILRKGMKTWLIDFRSRGDEATAIDWRDAFYLEQRLAGWLATTEQATDLNGIRKLHIANSRYIFELMLAFPPAERRAGTIQRNAINLLQPNLLRLPVNPRPPIYVRAKGKVGGMLRKYGLR